jgi:hypothetical protein
MPEVADLNKSILNMFPNSNNLSEANSELSMVWPSFYVLVSGLSD